ncbi:hypothetical protein G4177_34675 [Corallococcus sp. ZKHCc1 1396]|uniref:Tetratricopeptide repeat protein n=2 Tax=Corallococcus soli TaxID=2710757 RepID=A0ABR9PZN4_9BACT|nr:hypothetical protein [Corallococcus soli]MBE4753309.1 hypothetical protein [Corallococcus soli]
MGRQQSFVERRRRERALSLMALVLGGAMLAPRQVQAQESEGVRTHLRSAHQLYDALEYERALERLADARRFAANDADDVLLSLYEGVILADLGKNEASTAAFKSALQLQPRAVLPLKVSPKVERRFEDVRRQVRREREAQLALAPPLGDSSAPGAPTSPTTAGSQSLEGASGRGGARAKAWIPATVGGVLLVGGGVSYLQARSERSRLRNDDPSLTSSSDVDRSVSRGKTFQTVGWVLAGAGVAGLGLSAGMYLLGAPQGPGTLALGTDGTSAFVSGRWP